MYEWQRMDWKRMREMHCDEELVLKGRMGMERERDVEWIGDRKEENGEWSSEGRMNGSLSWN